MSLYIGSAKWRVGQLQDLVTLQRGFDITKSEQEDGEFPVVSSSGIKSTHNKAKVSGPGVIIGRKGTLGTVFFCDGDYWPHDTTLWSKDFHGNDPAFVFYALKSGAFEKFDTGAANPTLNRNHIHGLPVGIPDVRTQKRIASILSAYDDLIENNRRRIVLLEEAARQLYKEWFVCFRFPGHEHTSIVDGVPEGWTVTTMNAMAQTVGGGTPSTKKPEFWDDADITWFSPTDLTNNDSLVLLDSAKKINERGLAGSSAKMLPPETIMMSSRASVGFFGLYDGDACTNQGFISLIPKQDNTRMFLLFNLIQRREEIIGLASGATYKEINKSTFRAMPIIVPTEDLLKDFEKLAYQNIQQVRLLMKSNDNLRRARDLLLPRLMNGDITV